MEVFVATLWLGSFTVFGLWMGKRGSITQCFTKMMAAGAMLFLTGMKLGADWNIITEDVGNAIFNCLGGVGPFSVFTIVLVAVIMMSTGVVVSEITRPTSTTHNNVPDGNFYGRGEPTDRDVR